MVRIGPQRHRQKNYICYIDCLINMSHHVVYIIQKYLFSVYKHNIIVNKRQPFLVNQMATCFGCDYSHHHANV
jgi:hypothetical protein